MKDLEWMETHNFWEPTDSKRLRIEEEGSSSHGISIRIDNGLFCKIPPELFHHIFKFLSSEDLVSCSLACRFMNSAASDECLWRRLYCLRWGMESPTGKSRECSWKKLYIQRDQDDMIEFVRNTPAEFKEYYIQMQAAKRSQAPLPSQVSDDRVIFDNIVADQVLSWKKSRGFTDEGVADHVCSGNTCSYTHIGDVFLCEETGRVHVCDDTCREVILDQSSGLLVCTVYSQCFDRLVAPEEESDNEEDAAEPFMGSGRFARAYQLGYNCADEKELEATLGEKGVSLWGQVTSWKNDHGEELLFLSSKAIFKPPKAIHGGIPICFPQFSSHGTLEQHEFARNKFGVLILIHLLFQ